MREQQMFQQRDGCVNARPISNADSGENSATVAPSA
jgi:hypothetical protein